MGKHDYAVIFKVADECLRDGGYIRCVVNDALRHFLQKYRGCGLLVTETESCKMKHREQSNDRTSKNCKNKHCISSLLILNTAIDALDV